MTPLKTKFRGNTQDAFHIITHRQFRFLPLYWKIDNKIWLAVGQELGAVISAIRRKL